MRSRLTIARETNGYRPRRKPEVVEWALQGEGRRGRGSLDEERILIRDGELFGQHSKMGGYPDLYNHLLDR